MKWFKRIALSLFVVLLLSLLGAYVWLRSSKPIYDGDLQVAGLTQAVSVHFDNTGIPHIKAENKADLYRAFGYIHAQDRLFQMEMMRRVGKGNLAEVIGQKGIKIDRVFRTIGMPDYAQQSADELAKTGSPELLAEIDAYLAGINTFINSGATPPEFSLIGIPKTPFTRVDLFYITGAMSFSFSQAQKTEPVIDFISKKWGQDHLRDLALYHDSTETYIPSYPPDSMPFDTSMHRTSLSNANETLTSWSSAMAELEELLPFAPLEGSNSWVVAPERTKNKAVLFCNDTHIGYMLPQTWYEAHLICPNFEMYGHFLSGIPFALVGQNTQISWGLTMLENDDMDFYHEQIEGDKCYYKGQWTALQVRTEKISVKGSEDTTITIRTGPHGPLVDGLFDEMGAAVAISWSYTQVPNETVHAFREMNNATSITSFSAALPRIHGPGLNITYGDSAGNIAWWATAKLTKRPEHVNSWTLLDGTTGKDDALGFYTFEENPKSINPPVGYVYSANDWPAPIDSLWYPGYYKPQYRGDRIRELLEARTDWDLNNMKEVMTDHVNRKDAECMEAMRNAVAHRKEFYSHPFAKNYRQLMTWDGSYDKNMASPTLYTQWLYFVLRYALEDELGKKRFELLLATHQIQRAYSVLIASENSVWWDDVTTSQKETRSDIITKALLKSTEVLTEKFGERPDQWIWEDAAQLELKHPLGEVALFRPLVNRGPRGVMGGNETILQSGFKLDSVPPFKVYFGSQMRIITDFHTPQEGWNITPSGQSGHFMSPYYSNQAERYERGEFRARTMDQAKFSAYTTLVLRP